MLLPLLAFLEPVFLWCFFCADCGGCFCFWRKKTLYGLHFVISLSGAGHFGVATLGLNMESFDALVLCSKLNFQDGLDCQGMLC